MLKRIPIAAILVLMVISCKVNQNETPPSETPVFLEVLDPATEESTVRPLIEIPEAYNSAEVEKFVSVLENNRDDLAVKHTEGFFELVYGNSFPLERLRSTSPLK